MHCFYTKLHLCNGRESNTPVFVYITRTKPHLQSKTRCLNLLPDFTDPDLRCWNLWNCALLPWLPLSWRSVSATEWGLKCSVPWDMFTEISALDNPLFPVCVIHDGFWLDHPGTELCLFGACICMREMVAELTLLAVLAFSSSCNNLAKASSIIKGREQDYLWLKIHINRKKLKNVGKAGNEWQIYIRINCKQIKNVYPHSVALRQWTQHHESCKRV